jgi:hypothetical protein
MGRRVLHDHHPYGKLSLTDVLVKSSNIGMAKVGEKLQNENLHAAAGLDPDAPHMQFVEEGDLTLWLPVGKWQRADGEPINGNGVEPDEVVEVDGEAEGGDPVLDRALELAAQPLEQAA